MDTELLNESGCTEMRLFKALAALWTADGAVGVRAGPIGGDGVGSRLPAKAVSKHWRSRSGP